MVDKRRFENNAGNVETGGFQNVEVLVCLKNQTNGQITNQWWKLKGCVKKSLKNPQSQDSLEISVVWLSLFQFKFSFKGNCDENKKKKTNLFQ